MIEVVCLADGCHFGSAFDDRRDALACFDEHRAVTGHTVTFSRRIGPSPSSGRSRAGE